ncbi:PfkB family carbohydrate kinase [Dongia soli]|uniref:PfkB family carbohydrate kinase n=1 Tax=Dongia soli TaxID=600628 RepID=A0ABU5E888_9PROT|nr:PfkB family carbohydrate kinase [Dongia soli]MDY0882066.1 PfkB family carbohydrate kinase [Dongia soli]
MTRNASPKLVTVGDNCLDVYLTKDFMTVGGNALNVAVQWRRRGWPARYFGAVGNDPEGDIVLQEVTRFGLPAEDVERRPGGTAVTLLREEFGDRKFLLESFGVGENYMPAPKHYDEIAAADWVHLGTNANADLLRRLVEERIRFSIDVSTAHLALPLTGVPLVFASGPENEDEPVEPLLGALRKAGAQQAVLTCGRRGAFFHDGDAIRHVAATPVDVLDTCGAGDSFIASFVIALICEKRVATDALNRATAAAAQTCLHIGGFPQEPRPIPGWLLTKYADYIDRAEA